jgi:hypothetical protein
MWKNAMRREFFISNCVRVAKETYKLNSNKLNDSLLICIAHIFFSIAFNHSRIVSSIVWGLVSHSTSNIHPFFKIVNIKFDSKWQTSNIIKTNFIFHLEFTLEVFSVFMTCISKLIEFFCEMRVNKNEIYSRGWKCYVSRRTFFLKKSFLNRISTQFDKVKHEHDTIFCQHQMQKRRRLLNFFQPLQKFTFFLLWKMSSQLSLNELFFIFA